MNELTLNHYLVYIYINSCENKAIRIPKDMQRTIFSLNICSVEKSPFIMVSISSGLISCTSGGSHIMCVDDE
jgi:hypothetical protein